MDEQKKYEVIKGLTDHPGSRKERAALTLGCSQRHITRMLTGYKASGKEFFVHGNKGLKPPNTIQDATRSVVIELYRNKYFDANFTHFTDLLKKHEHISLSVSSVPNILEAEYILSPKVTLVKQKRIKKHLMELKRADKSQKEANALQTNLVAVEDAHSRRPRAAYFGEMLQIRGRRPGCQNWAGASPNREARQAGPGFHPSRGMDKGAAALSNACTAPFPYKITAAGPPKGSSSWCKW